MLHKGYRCEEEKGAGLRWVAETFVSEAEVISLIDTESDCEEFVELWQNGKSKEVKIKPKTNKQTKNPKHFQSWPSPKSRSKKLLCPLRTNQLQVKRQGHNLTGSHQSGTLQTVVTLEMFQVPLCEPASFQPIFQMAIDFLSCWVNCFLPLLHPYFLPQKKEEWIPTLWGFRLWTRDWTKKKKIKFSNRHCLQ